MWTRSLFVAVLVACFVARAESGESVRYFAIWSYAENAPAEEIEASALKDRKLGYWELVLDSEGGVLEGIYRNGSGRAWLSFRYVEVDERVYADLYLPDGSRLTRKSTHLKNRAPRWPEAAGESPPEAR